MAIRWYNKALQALGDGELDLGAGTFKLVLIDSATYTADTSDTGHEFLSSIDAGARLITETAPNLTWVNRVIDFDNVTLTDPGGGATGEALVLYKDTGDPATSRLIGIDDEATNLPLTLDGTNDTYQVNVSGFLKIGS